MRRRAFADVIEDTLFPHRCPVCGEIPPGGERICPECARNLPWITGRRCRICGKELDGESGICTDCREVKHSFDEAVCIFRYDEVMKKAVSALKYKGRREFGEILGIIAARAAAPYIIRWRVDAVVPVPVHRAKLRIRGYNQAAVIGRAVSEEFGLPMCPDLLVRIQKTEALKNLTREERRREVRKAFAASARAAVPQRPLITDDIYTTGATADACAAILKKLGSSAVFVMTLASGGGLQ